MADFELQEQLQELQRDPASYEIPNEHDISSMDNRSITALLESAVEALADSSDAITDIQVFDAYRSLLKHAEHLPGQIMLKLLDSISSAFQAQIDATNRDLEDDDPHAAQSHRAPLEMYAFLLGWFVTAAEKVKAKGEEDGVAQPVVATKRGRGRGGKAAAGRTAARRAQEREEWSWIDHIPGMLNLISKVMRLKTQRIWTTSVERETYISCITAPAYRVTETELYVKSVDIRQGFIRAICLAVKHQGHAIPAQINIMQSLTYYEHLAEPMAECLAVLAREYDHVQLCDEILREISGKSFSAQDSKGPRCFSRFLVRLTELAPRVVLKQISLLLAHLDSESYPMRMALVEVIGQLIRELAMLDPASNPTAPKQLSSLYDLLLSRTTDLSSYVRAKTLSTLAKLTDMPSKFPAQRLAATRACVDSLEDKSSNVRRGAVACIVRLVVTHPYGIYGGLLSLKEWEAKYEEAKKKLQEIEGDTGIPDDDEGVNEGADADAVEGVLGQGDEAEDEEEEDLEATPSAKRPVKKRQKNRVDSDEEMDVDEDDEGEEEGPEGDGDVEMKDDSDGRNTPKPKSKSKKSKKKPRQSVPLDLGAITGQQSALTALQSSELLEKRLLKRFCAEGLSFIRLLERGMKVVEKLLASTNKGEVLEAMEFFRVVWEYKMDGAEAGIKKMLHLIWSKDQSSTSEDGKELKGIRPRLLECYRSLYFDPLPDMEPKAQVNRIAKNMIELTYDATLAELTSLEEMLRIMMDDSQIHPDVISKLWQVYSSERPLPRAQRRGAVIILGMLALARRSVVADRAETLVKIGLGNKGQSDLMLARYTCVALQRLNGSAKKVKGSLLDKSIRLDMSNPVFRKLQEAMEFPCRSKEWFGMAEQAINTVYALGERPDIWANRIIKNLTKRAFTAKNTIISEPPSQPQEKVEDGEDVMDEDRPDGEEDTREDVGISLQSQSQPQSQASGGGENKDAGDAFEMAQLLFVVGHVAIKHIVYLEQVERELKRQKHERELAEKTNKGAADANATKDAIVEELEQVAGNAEDEIGERIAATRETELLYGPYSLLAVYGPIVVHICGSPHKFKNRTLRAAATLAFSKFLCVSSQFCDQHHRLLFKILETSRDASIRSNIVIALGDVAVSFSSIIDENNDELYKGLSDPDITVKKNTLMVLTHLILNGMIKVKGQLGEMAKCLEDKDERIADLAKLFFSELSTKDNAIYNNLPDVISHLSVGEHAVEEEIFQSTMRYIFTFIEKEKQAENIVEKLCQRFRLSEEPRQWRDIAFCLSLLPFKSERSVKKLIEGLQFYRDKLHEEEVYNRFLEILTKARSNKSSNKPDAELNEFEAILQQHKQQGAEDQAFEKRVEGRKAVAKKRASRRTVRKKTVARQEEMYESD